MQKFENNSCGIAVKMKFRQRMVPTIITEKNFRFMYSHKKNCGPSPNFHIHVSVSDLYTVLYYHDLPPILQQQYRQTYHGNIKSLIRNMNVGIGTEAAPGHAVPFLGIYVSNFYCVFAVHFMLSAIALANHGFGTLANCKHSVCWEQKHDKTSHEYNIQV
jgi:hypothetical protein